MGQTNPLPNTNLILDRDAIAYHRATLNENLVTQVALAADGGTSEHMRVSPDPRARANVRRLDQGGGVDLHFVRGSGGLGLWMQS